MKNVWFILWLVVFLCLYSVFFVLFQYKPADFAQGFREQLAIAQKMIGPKS